METYGKEIFKMLPLLHAVMILFRSNGFMNVPVTVLAEVIRWDFEIFDL